MDAIKFLKTISILFISVLFIACANENGGASLMKNNWKVCGVSHLWFMMAFLKFIISCLVWEIDKS